MTAEGADVRQLRDQVRDWRRGRVDTRWVDAFMDAYIAVFAALLLGSMAVSIVVGLGRETQDSCATTSCHDARVALPWAVLLLTWGAVLVVARVFGPAFATPAEGTWLASTPIDRADVVRSRLLRFVAVAVLAAGLVVAAAAGTAGLGPGVATLATIAATGALLVAALAAYAQQTSSPAGAGLLAALGLATWLVLAALSTGAVPPVPLVGIGPAWVAAAGALAVVAAAVTVVAMRGLGRLRRTSLSVGGRLAPSVSGALATLDLALLYDVLLARRWRGVGAVRTTSRGGPSGWTAVLVRDLRRMLRTPGSLAVLAGVLVMPYAAAAAGAGRASLLVAGTAVFLGGVWLFSGLRVLLRSAGLSRLFPFSDPALRTAVVAGPATLLVLAGLATGPAFHRAGVTTTATSLLLGLAVGAAGAASGVRWMTGRPPDYSRPLVSTPAGGVPTNLYGSVFRGFDILVLALAPVLLWPDPSGAAGSVALSLVTIGVLIGRR